MQPITAVANVHVTKWSDLQTGHVAAEMVLPNRTTCLQFGPLYWGGLYGSVLVSMILQGASMSLNGPLGSIMGLHRPFWGLYESIGHSKMHLRAYRGHTANVAIKGASRPLYIAL